MIRLEQISKSFGGVQAVRAATLDIAPGSITGLVGPNGAGKTTLFNVIAGLHKPDSGKVYLRHSAQPDDAREDDITGLEPHTLFHKGVLRTFQVAHEFGSLTVLDNLMVVPPHEGENLWSAIVRPPQVRRRESEIEHRAWEVLKFLQIDHMAYMLAENLSGGQKKLLELGRTMMVEPKIVFLDEVGAGVNRSLLRTIGEAIIRLNQERGYTFCLIEHDMEFITRLCERVIVMAEGSVLVEGTAQEIQRNEKVIEFYLGRGGKSASAATTATTQEDT